MRRYFKEKAIERAFFDRKCVIFDMNGVIIDDEMRHMLAMNRALSVFGVDRRFDYHTWIRSSLGRPGRVVLRELLPEASEEDLANILGETHREFGKLIAGRVQTLVRPGFRDVLRHAKALGKRVAVATAATDEETEIVLGRGGLDIRDEFDKVVFGEGELLPKPAPDIYLKTLAVLRLKPDQCVALEDSSIGVAAAKAAGLRCIAAPTDLTRDNDFHEADLVVSSLLGNAAIVAANASGSSGPPWAGGSRPQP